MNEIDSDDELQVLKRWWDENGTSILFSVFVVLAGIIGWNWWQGDQANKMEQSYRAFNNLVTELDAVDSTGDDLRIAQADFIAAEIKDNFPDSYYASFAAFLKAKQAVADKDLDAAIQELQWVADKNPSQEIFLTAKFRLAKVYFAQDDYDAALAELDVVDAGSFAMMYSELRGDIYLSQQNYSSAVEAYELAIASAESGLVTASPLLAEKLAYSNSFL